MKKMTVCVSLVCFLSMHASEKKSVKKDITNLDQLRSEVRKGHAEFQQKGGLAYYGEHYETKRSRSHTERSTAEDKK